MDNRMEGNIDEVRLRRTDSNAIDPKATTKPKMAVTWGKKAPVPRPNINGMIRTGTRMIAIHIFFKLERTIGST